LEAVKTGPKTGRLIPDTAIFQNEPKINPKSSEKGIQEYNFSKIHQIGDLKRPIFI